MQTFKIYATIQDEQKPFQREILFTQQAATKEEAVTQIKQIIETNKQFKGYYLISLI